MFSLPFLVDKKRLSTCENDYVVKGDTELEVLNSFLIKKVG